MTAASSVEALPALERTSPIVEFVRYFACSALALGVDSGLYWLGLRAGLDYRVAALIGFAAGLTTSYVLSVRWAFSRRSVSNARVEFLLFAAIGVGGWLLTEALLWVQVDGFGFGAMAAKAPAAMTVFVFNFTLRKLFLFTQHASTGAGE